jgi:RND family efflux transporter MFP subunit
MLVRVFLAVLVMVAGTSSSRSETVDCLVSPHRVSELAFGFPGLVEAINVERGDPVRKGQLLASLDTSIERSNIAIAEAQLAATAEIDSAKAQLGVAEKRLQRNKLLFDRGTLSTGQFEEIEGDEEVARLKLAELSEARRLRTLDVARARAIMALRTIVSPFDGGVVERHVQPGEYVDTKRVVTIAEIDPLFVDMIVPAAAFDLVRPGQVISVTLDHPPGLTVKATASVIDPFVDASSGTFRVRATLPNADRSIVAGSRCQADIGQTASGIARPAN